MRGRLWLSVFLHLRCLTRLIQLSSLSQSSELFTDVCIFGLVIKATCNTSFFVFHQWRFLSLLPLKIKTKSVAEEEMSSEDEDSGFAEDMEALRRACMLAGTNPSQLEEDTARAYMESSEEEDDDLELVRSIRQRFPDHNEEPLSLKPLRSLPPFIDEGEDSDDDFEILRAIEKRFANYDSNALDKNAKNHLHRPHLVSGVSTAFEQETSKIPCPNSNKAKVLCKDPPGYEDACNTYHPLDFSGDPSPDQLSSFIDRHQAHASGSNLSRAANLLMEAIKKNRSFQNTLRDKLIHIETRIEENKEPMKHVKLLKGFETACKKTVGHVFSQKKDPHVQLISSCRPKATDEKLHALRLGPRENFQVVNYRMMLEKFPVSSHRENWSKAVSENIIKGIKQQFQESLIQQSMELVSGLEETTIDPNTFNSIISPVADYEVKPETLRSFLPKVNWERLASMYVVGRSGAECEERWLNYEDPLINHNPWTPDEDKRLLYILQQRGDDGFYNWIDIATMLGTNRTPFQCVTRFQRSLNIHILKQEWTENEDAQLRTAVETFGDNSWEAVASSMVGRTGPQCLNRWMKTLNPAREKVGRWDLEEDKRLKVAVTLFGARAWNKIAQFVPGRTQVQCRERWINVLDPSLNLEAWSTEEDSRLKVAIAKHGHCWAKAAASVHPRTDNQCRRRWKVLLPHEVPVLQAARRVKKAALISNFVDRGEERPALGPSDFLISPTMRTAPGSESGGNAMEGKKKIRKRLKKQNNAASCDDISKKIPSKRSRMGPQNCQRKVGTSDVESSGVGDAVSQNTRARKLRSKNKHPELPLSPQPSEVSRVTIVNDDETFTENASSKKKAGRSGSNKSKCQGPAVSNKGLPLSPEPLAVLRITNDDDDVENTEEDNTKKMKNISHSKRTRHIQPTRAESIGKNNAASTVLSKGNMSTVSARHHQGPILCTEELRVFNCNNDESLHGNNCCLKKNKTHKLRSRSDTSTEPGQRDGDDATLASYLWNIKKKKRPLNAAKGCQARKEDEENTRCMKY